jgi:hypothetical protein
MVPAVDSGMPAFLAMTGAGDCLLHPRGEVRKDTLHVLLTQPGFLSDLIEMPELDLAESLTRLSGHTFRT